MTVPYTGPAIEAAQRNPLQEEVDRLRAVAEAAKALQCLLHNEQWLPCTDTDIWVNFLAALNRLDYKPTNEG